MSNHKGSEGTVAIGANTVAEIKSFEISESMEPIEDSELSDTANTYQSGSTEWEGSLECHWDETDTNGQGALTIGASVTLNMYPEGDDTGDTYYTGTALVTGITRVNEQKGMVNASFTFRGTGALTETTVGA